jgi:hypothetical protein
MTLEVDRITFQHVEEYIRRITELEKQIVHREGYWECPCGKTGNERDGQMLWYHQKHECVLGKRR